MCNKPLQKKKDVANRIDVFTTILTDIKKKGVCIFLVARRNKRILHS